MSVYSRNVVYIIPKTVGKVQYYIRKMNESLSQTFRESAWSYLFGCGFYSITVTSEVRVWKGGYSTRICTPPAYKKWW